MCGEEFSALERSAVEIVFEQIQVVGGFRKCYRLWHYLETPALRLL